MLCLYMLRPQPGVAMSVQLGALCRETRFDADMEEALVSSKLDAIGQEYNLLLAGQLEEQRRWYDGRHAQVSMIALTPHAQGAHSARRSQWLTDIACVSSSLRDSAQQCCTLLIGLPLFWSGMSNRWSASWRRDAHSCQQQWPRVRSQLRRPKLLRARQHACRRARRPGWYRVLPAPSHRSSIATAAAVPYTSMTECGVHCPS